MSFEFWDGSNISAFMIKSIELFILIKFQSLRFALPTRTQINIITYSQMYLFFLNDGGRFSKYEQDGFVPIFIAVNHFSEVSWIIC